jgi:dUTP pyrophosphatase
MSEFKILKIKKLSQNAIIPKRTSIQAAGYDLFSAENCIIPKRWRSLVCTDIAIQFPSGYYGRIAPRSGLASKHGLDVGAGVIDSDYRSNIKVLLFNHTDQDFKIEKGDRIAQIIFEKIALPDIQEVDELDETERNEKGFGSSGIK